MVALSKKCKLRSLNASLYGQEAKASAENLSSVVNGVICASQTTRCVVALCCEILDTLPT